MGSRYPCKWPLGIDVLRSQWYANKDKRLLAFQQPYIDQLGPNFEISILGAVGYTTFDPENVEAILSTRFDDFGMGKRRESMFPFIGEGIFTQDGPAWKHSRDLLRRPFLKTHYQDLEGFQEPINNLFSVLSSSTGVVDLQPLFFQFTLATTTSLIFGQSVESSEHDGEDSFGSTFDHASWITTLRSRLGDFYWAYNPSHYKAACDRIKDFADGFIKRALSTDGKDAVGESNGRYAFIRDLYAEYKDPTLVRDQLINILLAGRDTTACLLSWTLFLLVRHPDVLNRLKAEINSTIPPNTSTTRSHIQKIPYLKNILNESLRLYPPLPLNARFATRTTSLPRGGGPDRLSPVLVPKGVGVAISPYYLHRRKDIYGDDAMEFRPERWEEGEDGGLAGRVGWGYLPFHGGPRICLGSMLCHPLPAFLRQLRGCTDGEFNRGFRAHGSIVSHHTHLAGIPGN
ncbi:MAG: hypothetical protein L6R37_005400 [Teloschistes peruensis]|nr:MAG: hypothetical protein L6R37_005400 [Teloschistes peruensis]